MLKVWSEIKKRYCISSEFAFYIKHINILSEKHLLLFTFISGGQVTMSVTTPPCTANVCTSFPLYRSHSLTEKSAPPLNK